MLFSLFNRKGINVHGIGVFLLEVPSSSGFVFLLLSFVGIGSSDNPLDGTIFVVEFDHCFVPFF